MKKTIVTLMLFSIYSWAADFNTLVAEGVALHDQGKFSEAIEKYKEAEKFNSSDATLKYEICFSYYANKEYDIAINYCNESIKLRSSSNSRAYVQLGTIYDHLGKPDSAVTIYKNGLKQDPHSYLLKYNLAITLFNNKQVDEAYNYVMAATLDSKVHEGSYYIVGYLAGQLGKWFDEYSYRMYALMIGRSEGRLNESLNRIYSVNKSLVKKGQGDSVLITVPSMGNNSGAATIDGALILGVAMTIAADSINNMPLYSEKVSDYEFLVATAISTIQLISEMDAQNSLKPFYQKLVETKNQEAFARFIFSRVSQAEHNSWLETNNEQMVKFKTWLYESYL